MNLERQYDSLTANDISIGVDYVMDVLGVVGGIAGMVGGAATGIAALKMRK